MTDSYVKGSQRPPSDDDQPAFNMMGIPTASMDAWMHLQGFFAAGEVTPCYGRDEWTSNSAADKRTAIRLCNACPAKHACREFAEVNNELAGIWGGQDMRTKK